MRKTTKIFGLLLLAVAGLAAMGCSDDDNGDNELISAAELPQTAKAFIATYFPEASGMRVVKDKEHGTVEYDVTMPNGTEITFDAAGEWKDVDAPTGQTVPSGIVPQAIVDYISRNYNGIGVNEISRNTNGYEVELVSGVDLIFDADGNFQRVDN